MGWSMKMRLSTNLRIKREPERGKRPVPFYNTIEKFLNLFYDKHGAFSARSDSRKAKKEGCRRKKEEAIDGLLKKNAIL